jgi:hypothetical protein
MARYESNHSEEPGQYPTTAWGQYGLPEQNFGSGAPGAPAPSNAVDAGNTNEPGQYPSRDGFTGVTYSLGGAAGSGAPGTAGIPTTTGGGPDSVTYDKPTFYKGERDTGVTYDRPNGTGYVQDTTRADVQSWTEANRQGYNAADQWQMPGVAGNTPIPGSGQHQTGQGNVMYGGWLRGSRPATSQHPSGSGPGT